MLQDNLKLKEEKLEVDAEAKKEKKEKKKKIKEEKAAIKKTERGVETMFRITANHNMRLSQLADNKAHFLLTINSIIISLLVSLVLRELDQEPQYLIPSILFIATSLISIVYAILVTRPIITHGIFTKEDILNKRANLMFFGNYHNMDVEEYEWGVTTMMNDRDFLYGGMIRDNYNFGVILDRKYRRLRIAYNVFMFGFIISVIAYVIAEVMHKNPELKLFILNM